MDLPQEVPKPYPRNQKESERIKRIQIIKRKECKISTWIYRIALNTCISFYRKEKNIPEIVSLTKEIDWSIEAHDPVNEMLKQLYRMINQLGQLDKSIILLYLEEKSYEEIAEITGLTVTNVATKLSRIKDKLKKMKKED